MYYSYWDPLERRRALMRMIREMLRSLEEISEVIDASMEDWLSSLLEDERLLEERMRSLSTGEIEPLFSVREVGDEIVVIVDLPGAEREQVDIYIGEDRIAVEAKVREEMVSRAFGSMYSGRRSMVYKGEIRLPVRVDPKGARVERRDSQLVIRLPKK